MTPQNSKYPKNEKLEENVKHLIRKTNMENWSRRYNIKIVTVPEKYYPKKESRYSISRHYYRKLCWSTRTRGKVEIEKKIHYSPPWKISQDENLQEYNSQVSKLPN